MPPSITILGLGPGEPRLLTQEAAQVLQNSSEIYLRTMHHPCVDGFPRTLQIHSFDDLYEQLPSVDEVHTQIIEQVLELGRHDSGVIYAVPGHPYVAEATCSEITRRAKAEGIPIRIIQGLSFIFPGPCIGFTRSYRSGAQCGRHRRGMRRCRH